MPGSMLILDFFWDLSTVLRGLLVAEGSGNLKTKSHTKNEMLGASLDTPESSCPEPDPLFRRPWTVAPFCTSTRQQTSRGRKALPTVLSMMYAGAGQ
jgi:hypothetical protein